ncbi:MAG: diaminopimelate epimerase [Rickettsiales bacterium]|jgi:diaminopimelate epimerase|nr:diaminopimelate epimerase [Rickettsiales bacterium]
MKFTKMHGCGNDYVTINGFKEDFNLSQEQVAFLCTPHFGIGSEGLLLALSSKIADFRMRMFNVDGTEAEMCGNGIRCISRFAFNNKIVDKKTFSVETKSGIKYIDLIGENDVRVNMGRAEILPNPAPEYDLNCISVGNPHAVMIVENVDNFDVTGLGPKIENHKGFPKRTNVEFVEIIDKNNVKMRVWERGCGETFACGTGTCATIVALNNLGKVENKVAAVLKGGVLNIELDNGEIFMTGNAISVFDGEIIIA